MSSQGRLRITWNKSSIGYPGKQKGTIRALGLKRVGDAVEHEDTPQIRGMVDKVSHLVLVEEIRPEGGTSPSGVSSPSAAE